jgi:hypothetical protein
MAWKSICALVLTLILTLPSREAAGPDAQAQAQLLMTSPDVAVSGTYTIESRSEVLNSLLGSPLLLAKLWEANNFSPAYKARPAGTGIHIDDPTGIAGEIYLIQQTANRRVYVGDGALNHELVPAFRGKLAIVLTTVPKGAVVSARVDLYVRAESRMLGFLAWTLFPLLKARVEYRMTANAASFGSMLKGLSLEPKKAAALLSKEDAALLLKILPTQPLPASPKKEAFADIPRHQARSARSQPPPLRRSTLRNEGQRTGCIPAWGNAHIIMHT